MLSDAKQACYQTAPLGVIKYLKPLVAQDGIEPSPTALDMKIRVELISSFRHSSVKLFHDETVNLPLVYRAWSWVRDSNPG